MYKNNNTVGYYSVDSEPPVGAINDGAYQVVSKIRERMTGKVISMDEKRKIR